jgi:hypothetical protein
MAKRRRTRELSYYSWKRETKRSAARERLSRQTWVSPAESNGRRPVMRFLRYATIVAVLVAAISGAIALVLRWPGVTKLYQRPIPQSAGAPTFLLTHEKTDWTS